MGCRSAILRPFCSCRSDLASLGNRFVFSSGRYCLRSILFHTSPFGLSSDTIRPEYLIPDPTFLLCPIFIPSLFNILDPFRSMFFKYDKLITRHPSRFSKRSFTIVDPSLPLQLLLLLLLQPFLACISKNL